MPDQYETRLQFLENELALTKYKLEQLQQQLGVGGYVASVGPNAPIYQGPAGFIYTCILPQLTAGEVRNNVDVRQGIDRISIGPQTIWNPFGVGTMAGRTGCLGGDGYGNFVIVSASCL